MSSKHPMLWFCQNKRSIKGRNSQKTCLKNVGNVTEQPPRLYCKNLKYLVFSHFLIYANRSARVSPIVLYNMFRNRFWGIYLFRYLRRDPSPKLSHFSVMTGILQQLVLHTMFSEAHNDCNSKTIQQSIQGLIKIYFPTFIV